MESYELKPEQQQGCNEQQPMTSQLLATLQPTNYVPASPQDYYQPPQVLQQPTYQHNTVVVTQQQAPRVVSSRDWTSGLYGCFDDVGICFGVICCYDYASFEVVRDTGENPCLPCCLLSWLTALRATVRTQLGIQGSICNDCLVDTCCHCCALCQLKREVKFAKQNGLM
ncbi:placenta-specific gene 8 protein-like [Littorina saxatilis]|uniref:Uncharacterized protein n=1 Tax=Littorina saxatilis TaxID=31220 RepID=A0AAN9AR22_9CAEN